MWTVGGGHSWVYIKKHIKTFSLRVVQHVSGTASMGMFLNSSVKFGLRFQWFFIHICTHTSNFKAKMGLIKDAIPFCFLWKIRLVGRLYFSCSRKQDTPFLVRFGDLTTKTLQDVTDEEGNKFFWFSNFLNLFKSVPLH